VLRHGVNGGIMVHSNKMRIFKSSSAWVSARMGEGYRIRRIEFRPGVKGEGMCSVTEWM
jgi:hypothetical protein